MYQKQNLHTHTCFCDGKDTPEEMIQEALKRGFDSLGFSMHSYLSCSVFGIVTIPVGKLVSGVAAVVLAVVVYKESPKE